MRGKIGVVTPVPANLARRGVVCTNAGNFKRLVNLNFQIVQDDQKINAKTPSRRDVRKAERQNSICFSLSSRPRVLAPLRSNFLAGISTF
ncbi:MAG: hypothetical protein DWI02_03600 [Planctomycetota bacterium]|nr:MAG: hypothetical protein DWI02_03600 [Planctomycetota bacterium]